MSSDHVQRYHVRPDGYIFGVSSGKWINVRDVKQFIKNLQRYDNQGEWVRYEDVKHLIKEEQNYE